MCQTHMFLGLVYLLGKTALCRNDHNYHYPCYRVKNWDWRRLDHWLKSHNSKTVQSFLRIVEPMSVEPRMVWAIDLLLVHQLQQFKLRSAEWYPLSNRKELMITTNFRVVYNKTSFKSSHLTTDGFVEVWKDIIICNYLEWRFAVGTNKYGRSEC